MEKAAHKRVVVIGGGVCGLAAARELDKAAGGRVEIIVLEGSEECGGWLKTSRVEGVMTEQGPRAFSRSGAGAYTMQLVCDLGLDKELIPADKGSAKRFVYVDGKLQQATLWMLLRRIGFMNALKEFFNLGKRQLVPEEESVSEFFLRRFGAAMATVAQCIVGGVFAGDAAKLSLRHAFPSIHAMEMSCRSILWAGLLSLLGFYSPPPPVPISDQASKLLKASAIYNFSGGMETLARGLLVDVEKRQRVTVRTRCLAVGLAPGPVVKLASGESIACDHVITTLSPYFLSPLVGRLSTSSGDAALEALPKLIGGIPQADLTLVNIVGSTKSINVPLKCRGFGFLVPDGDIIGCTMDSMSFPQQYEGQLYKGEQQVALTVMIGGEMKSKDWLKRLDHAAHAAAAIEKYAGIVVDRDQVTFKVTNVKYGIPQYNKGHGKLMTAITQPLLKYNVTVAGMAVIGPGVNDCLLSALRAVQCIEQTGYFA